MNHIQLSNPSVTVGFGVALRRLAVATLCVLLAACGGSADAPPPPQGGTQAVPPTITLQPVGLTVPEGGGGSFTVAATGTAPLSYQWQRDGVNIEGATAATYAFAAAVLTDGDQLFRAIVSNVAGSATSQDAILRVVTGAPVLTITPQPADTSVVAGTTASFTVGGTCSSGTLGIQWQRSNDAAVTWANIGEGNAPIYSLATVIGDSGAQFRALLDCSGQSGAPSNAARLTVTPPGSVTLSLLPIVGLRDQAQIPTMSGIDQDPTGSPTAGAFSFITASRIKRLSADLSTITPVAGGPFAGSVDGIGAAASFNQPFGLTQDAAGNIFVADTGNHTIRRIAPDGTVTTLAGLAGTSGTADGTGGAARFARPSAIAFGPDGDLYVTELDNHAVRRVTTGGVVTTYAGGTQGYADGSALSAKFSSPIGVAVAANGDVLVADTSNNRIRRVLRAGNVAGAVQTLAGDGSATPGAPSDGIGTAAAIAAPRYPVVRGNTLTVRDTFGLLRQIDLTTAAVTTLTGSRAFLDGMVDGPAATARIRSAGGLTVAPSGGFMLADDLGLRLVSAIGGVRTIASGDAAGITPTGVGTLAQMPFALSTSTPQGVAVDPSGNVIVSDGDAHTVRRISPTGVVTLASGLVNPRYGPLDGVGSDAQLSRNRTVVADSAGVLFVIDPHAVRRIGVDNATAVRAGSSSNFGAVDGPAATARFNGLAGLAVGTGGKLFVGANNAVRLIDAGDNVSTFAGSMAQSGRVDGPVASARFQFLGQMAFAPDGSLYVVESGGGVLRRISPDGLTVSTVPAFGTPTGSLTIDSAGTMYYGTTSGLVVHPAVGGPSVLIPQGPAVVLGGTPSVMTVDALAVLGPKQLVLLSGGQILKATLP